MDKPELHKGVVYAIIAYGLWGIAPLYFKYIDHVSAPEILMHRVIWSFLLLLLMVIASGQVNEVKKLIKSPKQLYVLVFTSMLVGLNWLIFIWAINDGRILEASLGYYINPLLNVVLGVVFLKERLPKLQLFAVGLAALGVIIQLVIYGSIPWISLLLAGTFGVYGLLKKKVSLKAITGLFVETAILLPLALLYWFQLSSDTADFTDNKISLNVVLMCAGIVTTIPLLAFSAAAVRIPLYMLGIFQYIGPSAMFIIAITLFSEELDQTKLTTFVFIWGGLILLVLDIWRQSKRKKV